MRSLIVTTSLLFVCILATAPPCNATSALFWSNGFPYGSPGTAVGKGVGVDPLGNIVIVGNVAGVVDLGGGPLSGGNDWDVFIAKYTAYGSHVWSRRFGESLSQFAKNLSVNAFGDILVSGEFEGTIDFGAGPLTNAGDLDVFLVSFNSDGNAIWSKRFGDTLLQQPRSLATDVDGNVFLGGFFYGAVDFGGGILTSAGGNDIFLASYTRYGTHRWSKRFGDGDSGQWAAGAMVNQQGDITIVGSMTGTFSFGGAVLTGSTQNDTYVASFGSMGNHLWSKRFSAASSGSWASAVAGGSSGNVLLAGHSSGTINFGGGALPAGLFLVDLNSAGTHVWSRSFAGGTTVNSLVLDQEDQIVLAGEGAVDLGGGLLQIPAQQTFFLGKLDAVGNHIWSEALLARAQSETNYTSLDRSGNIVLGGWYSGKAEWGADLLANPTGDDVFIAKVGADPMEPTISSIGDVGNDQGRKVRIVFSRSGFDEPNPASPVLQYEVFRRVDPPLTTAITSRSSGPDGDWEFVAAVPAHEEQDYRVVAETLADSTMLDGVYYSTFFVRAATASPGTFFDSAIDSGYSVDNLAPSVPSNFMYSSGVLTWKESTAEDFDYFTIYGSPTEVFDESATVVDYTVGTSMDVAAKPYPYYFVTATDFAGNESKSAFIKTSSGVGDTPTGHVLSLAAYPNPFNPLTTIRYSVPSAGPVTVAIFDPRGVRVTTLVDHEVRNAGSYSASWSGTSSGRVVASGVYFVKIEHRGVSRSKKVVLLK